MALFHKNKQQYHDDNDKHQLDCASNGEAVSFIIPDMEISDNKREKNNTTNYPGIKMQSKKDRFKAVAESILRRVEMDKKYIPH